MPHAFQTAGAVKTLDYIQRQIPPGQLPLQITAWTITPWTTTSRQLPPRHLPLTITPPPPGNYLLRTIAPQDNCPPRQLHPGQLLPWTIAPPGCSYFHMHIRKFHCFVFFPKRLFLLTS